MARTTTITLGRPSDHPPAVVGRCLADGRPVLDRCQPAPPPSWWGAFRTSGRCHAPKGEGRAARLPTGLGHAHLYALGAAPTRCRRIAPSGAAHLASWWCSWWRWSCSAPTRAPRGDSAVRARMRVCGARAPPRLRRATLRRGCVCLLASARPWSARARLPLCPRRVLGPPRDRLSATFPEPTARQGHERSIRGAQPQVTQVTRQDTSDSER